LQWAEKRVVAILAIGHDEMKHLEHFGPPFATQLFDLIYAHLDICLLARLFRIDSGSAQLVFRAGAQANTE
jgi:hypothetical protein